MKALKTVIKAVTGLALFLAVLLTIALRLFASAAKTVCRMAARIN